MMTCCLGTTKSASSAVIDEQIKVDRMQANYNIKLLLLGTGDSGKSTFAKQMKILYKGGFSEKELATYKALLLQRTVVSMHALIRACRTFKIRTGHRLRAPIENVLEVSVLTPQILPDMETLWNSKVIKSVFARQSEFQIDTNAEYCLNNMARFAKSDYIPTNEDVLKVRQKTSGILETSFDLDQLHITLVDVGGQRSERRKWLHCFNDVTSVIYFINLGEFEMTLSEDYRVNRLTESLDLFEEISSSDFFSETDFFLFYNKDDKFREKVASKDFQKHFPDYQDDGSYDSCLRYIQSLFHEKCGVASSKQIHTFVTVSLDAESISGTLEKVNDILKKRLEEVL